MPHHCKQVKQVLDGEWGMLDTGITGLLVNSRSRAQIAGLSHQPAERMARRAERIKREEIEDLGIREFVGEH